MLGYFAIALINPEFVTRLFSGADKAFTLAAAGIGVGILTIPIIASVAEDAFRAVPMSLREASYGLGAHRLQTTFRVVFPAAISGIVAAIILGISRADRRDDGRGDRRRRRRRGPVPAHARSSPARR